MNFFGKYFKLAFLLIVLAELLSFFGYLIPLYNQIVFFVIAALVLIISLVKLEYGLYILLAELFIGSKGYLFYFESGGVIVSFRMALFLIIMAVWFAGWILGKYAKNRCEGAPAIETISGLPAGKAGIASSVEARADLSAMSSRPNGQKRSSLLAMTKWYIILFIFLAWGVVFGLLRGNSFNNVAFDFNAWLYFALIFPLLITIKSREQVKNILQILMAAVLWLSLKSLFVLFVMSHDYRVVAPYLYRWISNTGVGEITMITPFFFRIFFQSQIYVLIGLFILLADIIKIKLTVSTKGLRPKRVRLWRRFASSGNSQWLIAILALTSILISFSRSFWLGLLITFFALLLYLVIYLKCNFKNTLRAVGAVLIIGVISVLLISGIIKFPWPQKFADDVSFASILEERATTITGEAGVSSRWALLPPLMKEITKHPVVGSGFGATVTYKSSDPRIVAATATGHNLYTTYAFEWGYLDVWLKIGLAGLIVYLILIWKIWQEGWRLTKDLPFILGLLLGLLALVVTNGVSPYLNHPLGIGYLMLCSVIFGVFKNTKKMA